MIIYQRNELIKIVESCQPIK